MRRIILFAFATLFFLQASFSQEQTAINNQPQGVTFGTKIFMADGTEKNIEDIKEGDAVKTYNIDSLNFGSCKVKKLIQTGGSLIKLTFTGNKWIFCSANQPFFTIKLIGEGVHISKEVAIADSQKKWTAHYDNITEKKIEKLQIKDNVYFTESALSIQSISLQKIDFLPTLSARPIYNLELENGNVFIANGFIVKAG